MNKEIKNEAKNICYDIINFNLSFTLYSLAGFLAIFILVGRFDLPVIYLAIIGMFFPILYFFAWVFFMIVGAVKHFAGERYAYPMVIQFIK